MTITHCHPGNIGSIQGAFTYEAEFDQKHMAIPMAQVMVGVINSLNWLTHIHIGGSKSHHAQIGHGGHTGIRQDVGAENIGNPSHGAPTSHIHWVTGIPKRVTAQPGASGA